MFEAVTSIKDYKILERLEFSKELRTSPSTQAYYDSVQVQNLENIAHEVKMFIHKKLMHSDIHPKIYKANILFSEQECVVLQEKYKKDLEVISGLVDNLV